MESVERVAIRFTRRRGRDGRMHEFMYIYNAGNTRIFHARCEHGVISSFLERINCGLDITDCEIGRSRSGRTIYIAGRRAKDLMMRVAIVAGVRQCTRSPSKVHDALDIVAGLGEFETIFWYSRVLEEYERRGFWGVCRAARAFRVLYRIDG